MKICVYTVLTGSYERLNEQPVAARSACPFICLTDDPSIEGKGWRIQPFTPAFPADLQRSQRLVKFDATRWIGDYDVSLYIDNTVLLKATPEEIVARHLPDGCDFALPHHSYRATILDECDAVFREGRVDPARLFEQVKHYEIAHPEVLTQKPFWTGLLIRRHNAPKVREAMAVWARHVLRYSRRDQLSLNVALVETGVSHAVLDLDNNGSWCHAWPIVTGRDWRLANPLIAAMPTSLEVKHLKGEIAALNRRWEGLGPLRKPASLYLRLRRRWWY